MIFLHLLMKDKSAQFITQQIQQQADFNLSIEGQQPQSVIAVLKGAKDPASPLGRGIRSTFAAIDTFWLQLNFVFKTFVPRGGLIGFSQLLGHLVLMILSQELLSGC